MACKRSRVRLPSAPFPASFFHASLLSTLLLLMAGCGDQFMLRFPDPKVRIIAFGDSTTQGPARHDYVDDLPGLLGQPAEQFAKEGKGGETAPDSVDRLRSLLALGVYPNASQRRAAGSDFVAGIFAQALRDHPVGE